MRKLLTDVSLVGLYVILLFLVVPLLGFPLSRGELEDAGLRARFWPASQALTQIEATEAGEFLILTAQADQQPVAAVFQRWALTRRYRAHIVLPLDGPFPMELRGVYSRVNITLSPGEARVETPRLYISLQLAALAVATLVFATRAAALAKGLKERKG